MSGELGMVIDAVGAYRRALTATLEPLAELTPPPKRFLRRMPTSHVGITALNDTRAAGTEAAQAAARLVGRYRAGLEAAESARLRIVEAVRELGDPAVSDRARVLRGPNLSAGMKYRSGIDAAVLKSHVDYARKWAETMVQNDRGVRPNANPHEYGHKTYTPSSARSHYLDARTSIVQQIELSAGVEDALQSALRGEWELADHLAAAGSEFSGQLAARQAAADELSTAYRAALADLDAAPLTEARTADPAATPQSASRVAETA